MNLKVITSPKRRTASSLERVERAIAEHARTRRELDAALAEAVADGVGEEQLRELGQCEPGHGRHASNEADLPISRAI
ncbi:hypothetical protein Kpho02_68110 [Kitasatospora phosalacinea]|uniref:Uncharacterized protein n=1 Tax=Kitasatospora phosalacinea TaxID=2065 RepID=A0A9W6QGQ2_9ACTN|nr:hypothetical protein [Kitasatospora phosalacinea]GLW74513.1 hypothetical protein Kpho02_68110 [Kitasatospora phosalacinea]